MTIRLLICDVDMLCFLGGRTPQIVLICLGLFSHYFPCFSS